MNHYDLVIIGAGPGGYVSAIYGAKHGLKTAIIERGERLGGTCLNVGCIPTKTMIETANLLRKFKSAKDFGITVDEYSLDYDKLFKRKTRVVDRLTKGIGFLMEENGIDVINGVASFRDKQSVLINGETPVGFTRCIIATGSVPADLPHIKRDGTWVLDSTDALALEALPESIVIIGGGVIGVEFASIYSSFGVKVTIVELMDQLVPGMDRDIAVELQAAMKKMKVKVHTSAKVQSTSDGVVRFEKDGEVQELKADAVLLSVGRKPNTEGLNLEAIGIETEKGHVPVNANLETPVPGIYAIGDVIDTPKLAHLASREGMKVIHHIKGIADDEDFLSACPGVVYSYPEIATVGMTEEMAEHNQVSVTVATFPLTANSKAYVEGVKSGFVKVVADKASGRILGLHIIGGKASEMIGEATVAIQKGLTVEEMGRIIHPHPTMSESLLEAYHQAAGISIHI